MNEEHAPREPQSAEEAVSRFLNGDEDAAVSYLRGHKQDVADFCLRVKETYNTNDSTTPILMLGRLIESLL